MYKVKCPNDIYKNPCPGISIQDVLPEVTLKCGTPYNIEVYDYAYDQYICVHTWKVRYTWICGSCGDDNPGCDSAPISCCYDDGCLFYSVVGNAIAAPATVCTGSTIDWNVVYNFVDTCGKKHKCGFFFHGPLC